MCGYQYWYTEAQVFWKHTHIYLSFIHQHTKKIDILEQIIRTPLAELSCSLTHNSLSKLH